MVNKMDELLQDLKIATIKMEENSEKREDIYVLLMRCFVTLQGIRNKQIEDSWKDNPDIMGEQFTYEEIKDMGIDKNVDFATSHHEKLNGRTIQDIYKIRT
jgi:hypothetical protein